MTAADSQRLKLPVGQLIGEASDEECVRRTYARVVCDVAEDVGEIRQLLLLKTVRRREQDALQQLMRLSAQSAAFIKEPILTPLLAVGFTVLPLGGDQRRSCSDPDCSPSSNPRDHLFSDGKQLPCRPTAHGPHTRVAAGDAGRGPNQSRSELATAPPDPVQFSLWLVHGPRLTARAQTVPSGPLAARSSGPISAGRRRRGRLSDQRSPDSRAIVAEVVKDLIQTRWSTSACQARSTATPTSVLSRERPAHSASAIPAEHQREAF